jgi:hypothetical protein
MGRLAIIWGIALPLLAACAPGIPDNSVASNYAATQRDAQLAAGLNAPLPVSAQPLDPAARPLPASVTAAVNGMPDPVVREVATIGSVPTPVPTYDPVATVPGPAAGQAVSNSVGISTEQDFEAVSAQRSIESDAQRIAQNRAQYVLVTPTELPPRPGTSDPNIVEYALRTTHPVGTQLYPRSRVSLRSHQAACADFTSPDQAQIAFLNRGGPERDRRGLDPDGDGFACGWDPRPFRSARTAAIPATPVREPVADPPPPIISTE